MAALFCPYCSAELSSGFADCPSCKVVYDSETLCFLEASQKVREQYAGESRRHIRAQRVFKVAYASPKAFVKSYLFNLSLGGLFIETSEPMNQGDTVDLRIFLPDKGEALKVSGEVIWHRKEAEETPEGKMPPGMGVKFLDLSKGNIQRIITVLNRTVP